MSSYYVYNFDAVSLLCSVFQEYNVVTNMKLH
jgi:hypothetical protein